MVRLPPDLKRPPIIVVATHIDLLSPAMEWAPPYDWRRGKRPKEESIRQAVAAIAEQLGDLKPVVVPVCAAPGKVYGVDEFLLPAVAQRLDEATASPSCAACGPRKTPARSAKSFIRCWKPAKPRRRSCGRTSASRPVKVG